MGTCDWLSRGAYVVIAPAPIHQRTWALYSASHLRRGPISPFTNSARGKKLKEFASLFAPFASNFFLQVAASRSSFCGRLGLGEGGVGARLAFIFLRGRKSFAVFVQSFDRVWFLCCARSMGAQISKTAGKEEAAVEKPAEGAAVAAKTNGQVKLSF